MRVENGDTVTRKWTYTPASTRVALAAVIPTDGIDTKVTADQGNATLTATPSEVGTYDIYVAHSNGGTTSSLHTKIISYCPTGQVELPGDCAKALEPLKHWHESVIMADPPIGRELATFCNSNSMTAAESKVLTGINRAGKLWTCRYLAPSRVYIMKTDTRIVSTSEHDAEYGTRLVLDSEELLEGCQTITDGYWQCDFRGSQVWTRSYHNGDESDYLWDAFLSGVFNPGRCATFLTLTWLSIRSGSPLAINPQLYAGTVVSCGMLFVSKNASKSSRSQNQ